MFLQTPDAMPGTRELLAHETLTENGLRELPASRFRLQRRPEVDEKGTNDFYL